MRAFIFLAMEMASFAVGEQQHEPGFRPIWNPPTVLPLLFKVVCRVDNKAIVYNTRSYGVEKLQEKDCIANGWILEASEGRRSALRLLWRGRVFDSFVSPLDHIKIAWRATSLGERCQSLGDADTVEGTEKVRRGHGCN